ncbi:MAG: alpha-1,2-fucosyltransferase [Cytophagales bacterium]|nr:alpha-1,2-fucosyltransferase [Cytophagales bacterium]
MKLIIFFRGGLGNQIYQYVHGKYISETCDTPLICDTSFYTFQSLANITKRKFELFSIFYGIKYVNNYFLFFVVKFKFLNFLLGRETLIIDDNFNYNNLFLLTTHKFKLVILNGYFQNNPFFLTLVNKCYFRFKNYPLQDVNFRDSICLHVRKGDYLNNLDIYYNLSGNYFSDSIELAFNSMEGIVPIYIISDDINWFKNNVNINPNYEYVFIENDKSYLDFIFFKNFNNVIISNSTFSLTATILSLNDKNLVIAPKFWLVDTDENLKFMANNYSKNWLLV